MIFSNVIAFFIILTTASVLNANGVTNINSATEAANALRPLAGDFTFLPVRARASSAPACWRFRCWRARRPMASPRSSAGRQRWKRKRPTPSASTASSRLRPSSALASASPGSSAIHMLVWSAVLNGIVAVPIMAMMMVIVCEREADGPLQGAVLADRARLARHRHHGRGRDRPALVVVRRQLTRRCAANKLPSRAAAPTIRRAAVLSPTACGSHPSRDVPASFSCPTRFLQDVTPLVRCGISFV